MIYEISYKTQGLTLGLGGTWPLGSTKVKALGEIEEVEADSNGPESYVELEK